MVKVSAEPNNLAALFAAACRDRPEVEGGGPVSCRRDPRFDGPIAFWEAPFDDDIMKLVWDFSSCKRF